MFLGIIWLAAFLILCVVVFVHSTVSAQYAKPPTIMFEGTMLWNPGMWAASFGSFETFHHDCLCDYVHV
jgi:hypothetical protein